MSTLLWIVAAYIVIGFLLTAFGPLRKDLDTKILIMAATNPDVPHWKLTVFRYFALSGVVLLWVIFLPAFLRNDGHGDSITGHEPVTPGVGTAGRELRFDHMGGVGKIDCVDCGYAEDVTSFTHGSVGSSSGYQCQACGKFAARSYEKPFADSDGYASRQCPILEVEPKYRPSRIEHEQSLIQSIEC